MRLSVKAFGVVVPPHGDGRLEKRLDGPVDLVLGDAPLPHGLEEFPCGVESGVWHLHVGLALHARRVVVARAPVGDDKARKAPLSPQDVHQKVLVLIRVAPIHLVVGGHNRPGAAILHRDLKGGQIDLSERALIHHRVHRHPAVLPRVDRKVLGAGVHAAALNAPDVSCRHLPGQDRVLGEVLKIPSAKRISLHVEAGAQEDIHLLRQGFLPEGAADLLAELRIPAVCNRGGRRETGGGKGGVEPEVIPRALLPAQAVGAVGEGDRRNAKPRNIPGFPLTFAAQQRCLFQQCQF